MNLLLTKLQSTDPAGIQSEATRILRIRFYPVGTLIRDIQTKQQELEDYSVEYASLHYPVRDLQKSIQRLEKEDQESEQTVRRLQNTEDPVQTARRNELEQRIEP